jgi:hypothetical protein
VFRSESGTASLVGSFTMMREGRLSTQIALAASCLAQLISLPLIVTNGLLTNPVLAFPLAFAAIAVISALLGKMSGQKDIEWMEKQIQEILSRLN